MSTMYFNRLQLYTDLPLSGAVGFLHFIPLLWHDCTCSHRGTRHFGVFFIFVDVKTACVCMCVQGKMSSVVPAYRVIGGVSEVKAIWRFLAHAAVGQHCPVFLYEQYKEWHLEAMAMVSC